MLLSRYICRCRRTYVPEFGMKLSEWAERQGIHYMTAWRWWKADKLPVPAYQSPSGSIIVELSDSPPGRVVIYARVSTHDQRLDLDRQITRVARWATQEGLQVAEVVAEVGAGLNGKRAKLRRLLADPQVPLSWSSIETGWPGSGSSTWRRRWRPRAAGSSWLRRARPPMTSSATWSRC
jgi:Resolvase, N terminal domain